MTRAEVHFEQNGKWVPFGTHKRLADTVVVKIDVGKKVKVVGTFRPASAPGQVDRSTTKVIK